MIRSGALLAACLLASQLSAQAATTLLPDATVLPRRSLRVRVLSAWTRYDELIGVGDRSNLAAGLNLDSLTATQLPQLAAPENAIRAASGLNAFRLTAGRLAAAGDARIVTAPLIAEFGLSSRLTIGVVVPLVQTRTTINVQLNPTTGSANVGPNPALGNASLLAQNTSLVNSLTAAAAALQSRLAQCQAAPTSGTCPTLLAQRDAATSLIQTSGTVSSALAMLYGTTDAATPGQAVVPLATDPVQTAIAARIQSLRDQYKGFLGSDPIVGQVSPANGPAANRQLQNFLIAAGHDTLQTTDRSSIGDVTVGAVFQLANTFPDSGAAGGSHFRVAANGSFRIGTGQPASRSRFYDLGTGYGQPGVVGGLAADVQAGRWITSVVGSYTLQLGSVDVGRVPNPGNAPLPLFDAVTGTYSAGNVLSLALIPRYQLSGNFGFTGQYSLVRVGADQYTASAALTGMSGAPGLSATTIHQAGLGFTYSSLVAGDRAPGRIPFELTFSHLETLTASGGPTPKAFRDQIELRVYFGR